MKLIKKERKEGLYRNCFGKSLAKRLINSDRKKKKLNLVLNNLFNTSSPLEIILTASKTSQQYTWNLQK